MRKMTPKRAAIAARQLERRGMALDLRKKGATYRQIAQALRGKPPAPKNYDMAAAYRDVAHELALVVQKNGETADEIRQIEIQRLDRLLTILDKLVIQGDIQAINTAIRLGESRRKLLGLDAPTKIAPTTPDGEKSFGGVLMVPAPLTTSEWEACVAAEQAEIIKRGALHG